MELKHINRLEKPIAIEEIRVVVTPEWVDRWGGAGRRSLDQPPEGL